MRDFLAWSNVFAHETIALSHVLSGSSWPIVSIRHAALRPARFEYIEMFYYRQRHDPALGYDNTSSVPGMCR